MVICGPLHAISRSPRGERGLKLTLPDNHIKSNMSLPPRGAWIEIDDRSIVSALAWSLPPRGAWIEIRYKLVQSFRRLGRSPRGERGLK